MVSERRNSGNGLGVRSIAGGLERYLSVLEEKLIFLECESAQGSKSNGVSNPRKKGEC